MKNNLDHEKLLSSLLSSLFKDVILKPIALHCFSHVILESGNLSIVSFDLNFIYKLYLSYLVL